MNVAFETRKKLLNGRRHVDKTVLLSNHGRSIGHLLPGCFKTLFEGRHSLSKHVQRHQFFLVRVEKFVHLSVTPLDVIFQGRFSFLCRSAVFVCITASVDLRTNERWILQ